MQEEKPRKTRKGTEYTERASAFRVFRVFVFAPSAVSYFGLLTVTLLWLSAIIAAPLLINGGRVLTGTMVYAAFAAVCHQRQERAFHLDGLPLAVCARCFGIYVGFGLALIIYPLIRRLDDERLPRRRWLLLAIAPTAIDYGLGLSGLIENTHLSRLLTGALAGAAGVFYIVPGLVSTFTTLIINRSAGTPGFPAEYPRRTPDHE